MTVKWFAPLPWQSESIPVVLSGSNILAVIQDDNIWLERDYASNKQLLLLSRSSRFSKIPACRLALRLHGRVLPSWDKSMPWFQTKKQSSSSQQLLQQTGWVRILKYARFKDVGINILQPVTYSRNDIICHWPPKHRCQSNELVKRSLRCHCIWQ